MNVRDEQIVDCVNKKEHDGWRYFFDRYYAPLCTYVSRFLPDDDENVEDLVQDIFVPLWESKRAFSDIRELTNYMYRACYNNTLLYIRKNQIHSSILQSISAGEPIEDEEDLYMLTLKEETMRQLYHYISQLPVEQKRIITLRMEGHAWDEIAEMLGVSMNTIKTQRSRSFKFLRENIDFPTLVCIDIFLENIFN